MWKSAARLGRCLRTLSLPSSVARSDEALQVLDRIRPECNWSTMLPFGRSLHVAPEAPSSQGEVLTVSDDGKFLKVPAWLSMEWGYPDHLWQPLLLKRDCYDVLTSRIVSLLKGGTTSVILLGNSGIGKSGFCVYMLWWLLHHNHMEWSMIVLKFYVSDTFFIFTKDSDGKLLCSTEYDSRTVGTQVRQCAGPVVYLADKQVFQQHWLLRCKFILTCSPAKENYWHFSRVGVSELLYVPVWSLEEILRLNNAVFKLSEAEVKQAFGMWGGIPRYVLADRRKDVLLQSAIKLVSREFRLFPGCMDAVESRPDCLEANHRVFHYDVDESTCSLENIRHPMKFASRYVASGMANAVPPSLIDIIAGGKASDKTRAVVFDAFFHHLALTSLQMDCMEMDPQGKWGPLFKDELPLVRYEYVPKGDGNDAVLPERLPTLLLDRTMIKPASSSNRAWDLIIGRRILQTTVTTGRDTKKLDVSDGLTDATKFLKRCYGDDAKLEFIYFVPSAHFGKFAPSISGRDKTSKADSIHKFTSKLDLKVKKMCFRSGSMSDVEACDLLDKEGDSLCRLVSFPGCDTFEKLELRQELYQNIRKGGLSVPTPLQKKVLGALVAGANVLECASPGSGSTTAISISVAQRVQVDKGLCQAMVLVPHANAAPRVLQMIRCFSPDADLEMRTGANAATTTVDWHVLVGTPSEMYQVCSKLPKEQVQSISMLVVLGADEILKNDEFEDVTLCLAALPKEPQHQVAVFAHSLPPALLDFVSELESVAF